jgi:hypothetical protein
MQRQSRRRMQDCLSFAHFHRTFGNDAARFASHQPSQGSGMPAQNRGGFSIFPPAREPDALPILAAGRCSTCSGRNIGGVAQPDRRDGATGRRLKDFTGAALCNGPLPVKIFRTIAGPITIRQIENRSCRESPFYLISKSRGSAMMK